MAFRKQMYNNGKVNNRLKKTKCQKSNRLEALDTGGRRSGRKKDER